MSFDLFKRHSIKTSLTLTTLAVFVVCVWVLALYASRTRPTPPTQEQALRNGQLILLAEDNETNRDVLQQQLNLLGYTCEVAEDGAQALNMWRAGQAQVPQRYGLLLTDCHMPNLDGFGLTEAIRQAETSGNRLPIVAITANAMQGEAQRCRERGMDDYVSKPLRMQDLAAVLEKWLPLKDITLPAWSPNTLIDLVCNNPALHQRLLEKFLVNATGQAAKITAAAAASDTTTLTGIAHTLKSAARSVGALALGELCQNLETAGHAAHAPESSALAAGLDAELEAASAEIRSHLGL